jgi:hypothetical protein
VFGDARRLIVVGGVVLLVAGFALGYVVGRSLDDGVVAAPERMRSPAPSSPAPAVASGPVLTPSPERDPALTTQGAVLREGDRPVVNALASAPCQSLVTPGSLGECGEVRLAAGRVVWVVERTTTQTGATAITVRMFTAVPDAGGWVEWLQAGDPTGERWADVNVLSTDLTADGVPELVVGFRDTDERATLEVDVVGYEQDGVPVVLAHPDDAPRGVVVASGGNVVEYAGQFPNQEPACCPASYVARTIAFEDGFFRVVGTQEVAPNLVPASQL